MLLWNFGFAIVCLMEVRFWTVNWLREVCLVPFLIFLVFFPPIPIVFPWACSHVPMNGGGWYILILGAPGPPWDVLCWVVLLERLLGRLLVLLRILGAPLPVIFFNSFNSKRNSYRCQQNATWLCFGFILTPEPVWRVLRISSFCFVVKRCL